MSDFTKKDLNEANNKKIIKELADVKNKAFTLLSIMIPTLTAAFGLSLKYDGKEKKFLFFISFLLCLGLISLLLTAFIPPKKRKDVEENNNQKALNKNINSLNLSMVFFTASVIFIAIVSFILL